MDDRTTRHLRIAVKILIVVVVVVFIYGATVFNTFWRTEAGFVYDPKSDELFAVDFRVAVPHSLFKKEFLNPFHEPYLGNFDDLAPIGLAAELTQRRRERNRLFHEDFDEYARLLREDLDQYIVRDADSLSLWAEALAESIQAGTIIRLHTLRSVASLWRVDLDPVAQLPGHLQFLAMYSDNLLRAADILVLERTRDWFAPDVHHEARMLDLSAAVVITGRAAHALRDSI